MAQKRMYLQEGTSVGVYHCVSRICDKAFRINEEEKAVFVRMMRGYERFCQVEILTFCVMSNHFHLLVRVPERPAGFDPSVDEVLAWLEEVAGEEYVRALRKQFEIFRSNGSEIGIEEWRQRQVRRMFSLSFFMKAVKQRFAQWYNKKEGREGVLWSSVFKSVLVDDAEKSLRTMAAYIDLNPVRARLVDDPADYVWSGYGEAMRGNVRAQEGLAKVVWSGHIREEMDRLGVLGPERIIGTGEKRAKRRRLRALVRYRNLLGMRGRQGVRENGTPMRKGLSEALVRRFERETDGDVAAEVLMRKVRHFTAGAVVGSRAFVERWFEGNRERCGPKRKTGARPMKKTTGLGGWWSLRDLRG
jgi:putative transposase